MAGLTLDAGALIAYERGDERIREILSVGYARGLVPTIPAIALAEVWRGEAKDARVARLLKACSIETVDEGLARAAGALRRRTPGSETIDACIAAGVLPRRRNRDIRPPGYAGAVGITRRHSFGLKSGWSGGRRP